MTTTYCPNGFSGFSFLLKLFLVGAVLFAIAFVGLQVIPQPHPENTHALSEVESIRLCINGSGPFMTFREPDKATFHLLCKLPDGRIGDQIVVKEGKDIVEKTSFVPKDGTWKMIYDWLIRKGATKFTGEIK